MKNSKKLMFILIISALIGCKKEKVNDSHGEPFKIFTLSEMVNGKAVNKTQEIPECRLDDEFYFNPDDALRVLMNNETCNLDPTDYVGGFWKVVKIDSLSSDFLELNLPYIYKVHDSIPISETFEQFFINMENQYYEIKEFSENRLILQNSYGLSFPQTKNIWRIEFQKGEKSIIEEPIGLEPTTDKISFPQKYKFTGVDFRSSEFFEFLENGLTPIIPDTDLVSEFDSVLLNDYFEGEIVKEFLFQEMELLSDSLTRLKITGEEIGQNIDTTFYSELSDDKIRIYFEKNTDNYVEFWRATDNKQFYGCLQTHTYNYYNTLNERREYQAIRIQNCTDQDKENILKDILDQEKELEFLKFEDTLLLNVSRLTMDLID